MTLPTAWDDELFASLPGATTDLVKLQLQSTIRDFCRRSGAWIVDSTLNIKADRSTYDFSKISQGEAVMTMAVIIDEAYKSLADVFPATGISYRGSYVYSTKPGVLVVEPTPTKDIDNAFTVSIAYMPIYDATSYDDLFGTLWYDYILDGVKARMMSMPGKPFSNLQLAAIHQRMYKSGISNARDTARRRFSMAESTWRYPGWA